MHMVCCRLPVSYSFDHPAGYHEEGSAFAHVQRVWGESIVPEWLNCLGYHFRSNGFIEVYILYSSFTLHFPLHDNLRCLVVSIEHSCLLTAGLHLLIVLL